MTPRRIVFTGDFLRPGSNRWRPTQHFNVRWVQQLFGTQIAQATGLPVETVIWGAESVGDGILRADTVGAIYDHCGIARRIEGWARLYGAETLPPQVEALIHGLFRDAIVVAFELPPVLQRALTRAGIPFVEAINHPVRFLDDIFFGFRSNHAEIRSALAGHAISETEVRLMGGIQSAAAQRMFRFRPEPESLLFLMQVKDDKSQIRDGRFVSAGDFLDEIAELGQRFSRVYVKQHPMQKEAPATLRILARLPNAQVIEENFYSLAATDQITAIASLSSSTTVEAQYFGKTGHFVLGAPYRFALDGAVPSHEEYVGVFDAFLAPDFWRDLLAPITPVTARDGIHPPFKPNRLRASIRNFWGFNEIDTDAAAGPPINRALGPVNFRVERAERNFNQLRDRVGGVENRLRERATEFDERLKNRVQDVENRLRERATEFDEKLKDRVQDVNTRLGGRIGSIEAGLEARIGTMEATLRDLAERAQRAPARKPAPKRPTVPKPLTLPADLMPQMKLRDRARLEAGRIEIGPGPIGHAVFGPYLRLPPGAYRVFCETLLPGGDGAPAENPALRCDIAFDAEPTGPLVDLATLKPKDGRTQIHLPFTVREGGPQPRMEFRVWADAAAALTITALRLESGS